MVCNTFQSDSACVAILEPPLKVCAQTSHLYLSTTVAGFHRDEGQRPSIAAPCTTALDLLQQPLARLQPERQRHAEHVAPMISRQGRASHRSSLPQSLETLQGWQEAALSDDATQSEFSWEEGDTCPGWLRTCRCWCGAEEGCARRAQMHHGCWTSCSAA